MVFLRKKKVKGYEYLYLVKSVWDVEKRTSRQKTIKYLGEVSTVTKNDIPKEYRDNARINSFLLQNMPKNGKKREELIEQLTDKLFTSLTEGNQKNTIDIYRTFTSNNPLDQFYEKVLTQAMIKIGDLWAKGKLSIATEHVASNTAHSLIKVISDDYRKSKGNKGVVILTTPVGEDHNLGCNMLGSFLVSKGFSTFDLSPSTPSESLIKFIKAAKPNALFVSITLEENIKYGQRMVKKIHGKFKKLKIFIGGQAFSQKSNFKFDGELVTDTRMLNQISRAIKTEQL